MKFIICRECQEPVFLRRTPRRCGCGLSAGVYRDDIKAEITGPCVPFGIHSGDLGWWMRRAALDQYPEPFKGDVRAWCMPEYPDNITRVESIEEAA